MTNTIKANTKFKEIWRDVKNYEGLYEVSDLGNVRNARTKRVLKPRPQTAHKYLTVNLYKDGKMTTVLIHRLVAEAFCDNPDNLNEVDHINSIPTDNRADNLRYVTHQKNCALHYNDAALINQYDLEDNYIATYVCVDDIVNENKHLNWNKVNLFMCLNKWNKTAYGFKWIYSRYADS